MAKERTFLFPNIDEISLRNFLLPSRFGNCQDYFFCCGFFRRKRKQERKKEIDLITIFIHLLHFFLSLSVPPRVRAQPQDGNIVVKKNSEVTLECEASGNPVPKVTWSRDVSIFPFLQHQQQQQRRQRQQQHRQLDSIHSKRHKSVIRDYSDIELLFCFHSAVTFHHVTASFTRSTHYTQH